MPFKLDSVDVAILRALSQDGRKSLRQLAKTVKVSTPTVNARLMRMIQSGIISKIAPIYNVNKLGRGIGILLWLKVETPHVTDLVSEITKLDEVKSVFATTGEGNLLVKIFANSYDKIQSISDRIGAKESVNVLSTQMITKTFKDEQGIVIEPDIGVQIVCDHCKGMIAGDPLTLKVLDGERYFCCRTCLTTYKEKYKSRIQV